MGTRVRVIEYPKCDFCELSARYDGKTIYGPWANMCFHHFMNYGIGLGTGKGQRLVMEDENAQG